MLTCLYHYPSTIKHLHVVIVFPLAEYDMCSCLLLFILHLHNPAAAQMDVLKTILKSSTVSRRGCHQSTTCGDVLFRC
jgi:hypothetical protein